MGRYDARRYWKQRMQRWPVIMPRCIPRMPKSLPLQHLPELCCLPELAVPEGGSVGGTIPKCSLHTIVHTLACMVDPIHKLVVLSCVCCLWRCPKRSIRKSNELHLTTSTATLLCFFSCICCERHMHLHTQVVCEYRLRPIN